MTANDFLNKYNGQYVNSCGGIKGQCVAEVQLFANENGISGCPVFNVAAAKDMVGARPDSFNYIPNTPTGVPVNGDLIIWNTAVGAYGHTAIFLDGNASSFRSVDQNWPTGSPVHVQSHNYNGVVGWLRQKGSAAPGGGNMETKEQVENRLLHGPGGVDDWKNQFAASQGQVKQLGDRVNEMQKTLDTANKLIESLKTNTTTATQDKKIAELQAEIEALKSSTPTTLDSFSFGQLLSAAFSKLLRLK